MAQFDKALLYFKSKIHPNENFLLLIGVMVLGFVFLMNIYVMNVNNLDIIFVGIDGANHIPNVINQAPLYQPLTIFILSIFFNAQKPEFFYFVHAAILFIIIPFLLFKTRNHFLPPLFYYASYFVWMSDNNGTFPQTLIVVLLLGLYLIKNNYIRILIVLISFGIHSTGWMFLLIWLFILNFKEVSNKFLLLVPCAIPKTGLTFAYPQLKQSIASNLSVNFGEIANLFTRILFLPLWFFTIKGLLMKENRDWLLLAIFLLVVGVFSNINGNLRILSMLVLPFAIGLTDYYKSSSTVTKKIIILMIVVQLVGNVVSWVERKNILYCDLIVHNVGDFVEKTSNKVILRNG